MQKAQSSIHLVKRKDFYRDMQKPKSTFKTPPQAVEIEKQVLGAILNENEYALIVSEILTEHDFYDATNGIIYSAIMELVNSFRPADIVTVGELLRQKGKLEGLQREPYLAELTLSVTSARNVEHHAKIIADKSILRRLIAESSRIVNKAYEDSGDALELVDEAESNIFKISDRVNSHSGISLRDSLRLTVDSAEEVHGQYLDGVTGISTGFTDLDRILGGWQAPDLILIAGRPGSGKTAFGLSVTKNAITATKPTGTVFFSFEMSHKQLSTRIISAEARVNSFRMKTGRLTDGELINVKRAEEKLATAPLFIEDNAYMGLNEIRSKARKYKSTKDIGLIVVDYLQLMRGAKGLENREKEIAAISRGLKCLAKELEIPVIALSQLNRGIEARIDKRPVLSDLRESGALEQDADIVCFVHRPSMFTSKTAEEYQLVRGKAEIIVGKHRDGEVGDCELAFIEQWAGFENLDRLYS